MRIVTCRNGDHCGFTHAVGEDVALELRQAYDVVIIECEQLPPGPIDESDWNLPQKKKYWKLILVKDKKLLEKIKGLFSEEFSHWLRKGRERLGFYLDWRPNWRGGLMNNSPTSAQIKNRIAERYSITEDAIYDGPEGYRPKGASFLR